jgi:hypothetical protein
MVRAFPGPIDMLIFGDLVRLDIQTDGTWKTTYVSHRDAFPHSWDAVWEEETIDFCFGDANIKARLGDTHPENSERLELFPNQLTEMILKSGMWDPLRYCSTLAPE